MRAGSNILYIGPAGTHTTSRHRADALRRLGHQVEIVDPNRVLPQHRLLRHLNYRTGYRFVSNRILDYFQSKVERQRYDLVWVNGGYAVSARAARWLRGLGGKLVCYCNDDPTGWRDRSNWSTFRASIPEYDLCVIVRDVNAAEFAALGAKRSLRVMMSYDEIAHSRLPFSPEDESKWSSEVVFVGTWMLERGPFMAELLRRGVPLAIYGDRWDKAAEWPVIKPYWRGAFASGPNYVKAIQYAKIAIGMLSKGNRDMHTQRSTEIPFIGTVFCAERTPEHLQMFEEGEEALFWSGAEECAAACHFLLEDAEKRNSMTRAARAKVETLALGNETVCRQILAKLEHE